MTACCHRWHTTEEDPAAQGSTNCREAREKRSESEDRERREREDGRVETPKQKGRREYLKPTMDCQL
jgi:hypothetical protein